MPTRQRGWHCSQLRQKTTQVHTDGFPSFFVLRALRGGRPAASTPPRPPAARPPPRGARRVAPAAWSPPRATATGNISYCSKGIFWFQVLKWDHYLTKKDLFFHSVKLYYYRIRRGFSVSVRKLWKVRFRTFFRTLSNILIWILSEKFLYFNDDISFTKPICLSDFWTSDHGYKEMTLIL